MNHKDPIYLAEYPELLTVDEVQKILRIGRSKAYELVKAGEIFSVLVGSQYRIPKISILNYLRLTQ